MYRRDGGENASESRSLIEDVSRAIANGDVSAGAAALTGHATRTDLPIHWKALILQLLIIARGEYNSDVAADLDLDYRDAVELELLLAGVARPSNRR